MFALSTDLYELAMMAAYRQAGVEAPATFELFVRELPPRRAFLIAAGLEQALAYLGELHFTPDEIEYLRALPNLNGVPASFFDEYLPRFRFTGDVWAVPEGTPMFPQEPFLRVTAPVMEAQLVETALLAAITFPTSIASKAARVVLAAAGRPVMEFGSRRAHGLEAARLAARAAYLAGCASTSNVEAGWRYGIPVSGTMAHSWVMMFADEVEAFRRYMDVYGERAVLLIDTYDSATAARRLAASELRPAAVRIDSGDLDAVVRQVRAILDGGGLGSTKILASGDLDEYRIQELVAAGAPVDGFGVGTALSTSRDAPALGGVYKVVEVERGGRLVPTLKRSPGKASLPGRKQVWRSHRAGRAAGDLIALEGETPPEGSVPLLERVMAAGRCLSTGPVLAGAREHCRASIASLPDHLLRLDDFGAYPVHASAALDRLADDLNRVP